MDNTLLINDTLALNLNKWASFDLDQLKTLEETDKARVARLLEKRSAQLLEEAQGITEHLMNRSNKRLFKKRCRLIKEAYAIKIFLTEMDIRPS